MGMGLTELIAQPSRAHYTCPACLNCSIVAGVIGLVLGRALSSACPSCWCSRQLARKRAEAVSIGKAIDRLFAVALEGATSPPPVQLRPLRSGGPSVGSEPLFCRIKCDTRTWPSVGARGGRSFVAHVARHRWTLGVDRVDVAIDFPADADYASHHRALATPLSNVVWAGCAPDLEEEVIDTCAHRTTPLGRAFVCPCPAALHGWRPEDEAELSDAQEYRVDLAWLYFGP